MGIGAGVTLLAIGAICAFGIRDRWDVVDLTAVGYICLAAGALAVVLALVVNQQRASLARRSADDRREPPASSDVR